VCAAVIYATVRPILFALDAERAHQLALDALRATGQFGAGRLRGSPVELMGLRFPNRVGLAAGFDKNGIAIDGIGRLGFGFIEVGTVTPNPQPGQPRPRLLRLPAKNALVNCLGFPNEGARVVAERLRGRQYRGIIGINIGKNASTPIDRAVDDYVLCLRALHPVADYVAINISSPNTDSLRDLHEPQRLELLLNALLTERDRLLQRTTRILPLLLKISPDLDPTALQEVARTALRCRLDGLIATNTTVIGPQTIGDDCSIAGGLSGAPLHTKALSVVEDLRKTLGQDFPIVGLGGIDSAETALAMRKAGADLVQLYSGLIYRGPKLVRQCIRVL
jgi:dihydroorotate dehydrogenase